MDELTGGDETAADDKTEAQRLATELSRVRRRGVAHLNVDRGQQKRIDIPILERIAAERSFAGEQQDRVVQIQQLLDSAITDYGANRNLQAAALIRRLFSDEAGRWPGPGGARQLLSDARVAEGITDEEQFRRLQRQRFLEFADFLLEDRDHPSRSRRTQIIGLAVIVFVIAAVVTALVVSHSPPKSHATHGSSTTTPPTVSGSSTPPAVVMFRFDNLGSTVAGGTTLEVYPGVRPTTADRTHNGSYNTGDVVRALCITTGRTVASDPHYNETPKTTNLWVRINAVSGQIQYATLTYGELIPASAKLPPCQNVG